MLAGWTTWASRHTQNLHAAQKLLPTSIIGRTSELHEPSRLGPKKSRGLRSLD